MDIVEGHTNKPFIKIELQEGKLKVYPITEAKLKLFRDGGSALGRINDWAYTSLTCGISFLVAWLTTNIDIARTIFATLTIVCLTASIILFIRRRKRKTELSVLYDEVISGEI